MLDKTEYYHGAAIVRLLEDGRCRSIHKRGRLGYIVNDNIFLLLKYTSRSRTPWGFTFDLEDVERCIKMSGEYRRVIIGLICGGDGVCALDWPQAFELLGGKPGRIASGRKHNHSYDVWGTEGELKRKVSQNRWPTLMFEDGTTTNTNEGKIEEQHVGSAN